jgi:hypothetical protein
MQQWMSGKVPGLALKAQVVRVMMGDGKRPGTDIRLLRVRKTTNVMRKTMCQHGIRRVQVYLQTPGGDKRRLLNVSQPHYVPGQPVPVVAH